MSPLPTGLYELFVAPLAVSLAFIHARRALGSGRAAGELVALAAYGYGLERAAIAAFAAHEYPPSWRVAPGGVPLAVVVVWAAVISSAMAVAVRRGAGPPASRAASAALLALVVDVAMEPVAVRAGLWRWTPPGAWLGVPVGNFVGWAVIVGSYTLGAERWAGSDRVWLQAGRRVVLAVGSVLALLAVGAAWRGLAAETLFTPAGAWTLWGAMILGAVFATRGTGRGGDPMTLAGRLGAAGRALPGVVLLLVAAPFVVQAILFGDRALILAAAVSLGVLMFALR